MNETILKNNNQKERIFFLTEIIRMPVIVNEKKIGRLIDFVIIDRDKFAEVTHISVGRPFGYPTLIIPWNKVGQMSDKEIVVDIKEIEEYAIEPDNKTIFLKDYILDKRVLDVRGRKVEIVYDVKMVLRNNRLYLIDVDLSRSGFLRRIGLRWLSNFIDTLATNIKKQTIPWNYVEPLSEEISSFKGDLKLKVLKEELSRMPPEDLADILEEMDHDQRVAVFNELETEQASDTLEELDPTVQRPLIASIEKEKTAQLIKEMSPAQAADIFSILPMNEAKEILRLLPPENGKKINSILEAQEIKILDFVITNYLKIFPDKTAKEAKENFQNMAKGKDVIMYLYIIDQQNKLLGIVHLKELLMADDESLLKDIMTDKIVSLNINSTLKEASEIFSRYGFRALPVVDQTDKMLGVLPYRDLITLKQLYLQL